MDCSRIDDLLVDYIYQELNPAQVELFEAHLQGCERCTHEVSAYESTRTMLQGLPEEDPPAQISALLLQEAARAVQPAAPGFWERVRLGMRGMVMHPATTAAMTLVMVLGISFYVYKSNPVEGDRPRVDLPLVEEGSPTATITMKEGQGAASTTEKSIDDKRAAAPSEAVAANEDERARDIFTGGGKAGLKQAPPSAEPRPEVAVTRGAGRSNVVGTTSRGRLQARQVLYKDGVKGIASRRAADQLDNTDEPAQKQVLMPPPPSAVAAGPARSAAAQPARRARKKSRVTARKGPGIWDDEGLKGESLARVAKSPPPPAAPRTDNARNVQRKAERKLADRSVQAEQAKRPLKTRSTGWAVKPKPRAAPPAPRPRPVRVARRPALTVKKPAPEKPYKKNKQAGKSKGDEVQASALSALLAGNTSAKKGRCLSALDHFNRALTRDRSLRTRVASAMRTCTRKMNLDQLLRAQKRHQMLAGLLESDIKRARQVQYAARKARARKAKKARTKAPAKKRSKGKKSTSVDAYEAPSSTK